jgi:hypothetical protein
MERRRFSAVSNHEGPLRHPSRRGQVAAPQVTSTLAEMRPSVAVQRHDHGPPTSVIVSEDIELSYREVAAAAAAAGRVTR